ncbi:ArnT family glycosyltransferase [Candidatus Omnitrophota bacterium]
MRQKTATFDEIVYMMAGYTHLTMRDLRMEPCAPPLTKIIAGIPLLFLNLKSPAEFEQWHKPADIKYINEFEFAKDFLYRSGQDADKILFFGRISSVLTSLLLGFWVFHWSRRLYGLNSGYFALFLYVFSPNILAHSRLVTPDIGFTCALIITMYYFWRFLCLPSNFNFVISAVCLGVAQLTKYSALLLFPVFLFLLYFYRFRICESKEFILNNIIKNKVLFSLICMAVMGIIAFSVVWAGYGFEYGTVLLPKEDHDTANQFFSRYLPEKFVSFIVGAGEKIPVPAPSYFYGMAAIKTPLTRDTFILGRNFPGSPWYAYIVAFIIKTPIPALIFIIMALLLFVRKKTLCPKDERVILAPVIGFAIASAIVHFEIQLKYILPVYPLLFIFVSQVIDQKFMRRTFYKLIFGVLCLWYLLAALNIFPHYIPYFNEFIGGPKNGYKYLVAANLDWGQDLKLLRDYLKKNGIEKVKLSYYGTADPDYYDIKYEILKPFEVSSGWIAVSATHLQGVHTAKEGFSWLKKYKPVTVLGYSIFLYNIDPE